MVIALGWLLLAVLVLILSLAWATPVAGQDEYSRPVTTVPQPEDIGQSYELPPVQRPLPRSAWWYLADIILLTTALVATPTVDHQRGGNQCSGQ